MYLMLAVVVTCAVIKLPTLWFPHEEADEVIYWQLTDHLAHTGRYSLQGTTVLPYLDASVYDRPLFHHPPAFALLLMPFVLSNTLALAVTVSWMGHRQSDRVPAVVDEAAETSKRQRRGATR